MQDYLQSLYEQCEFGEFSKDHPLQAALYTHSIRETTKNQAILDENVLELVKTVRKTSNHVKQWNFADADTLVDMVLDLAPPIYVEEASIGKSMSESLDDFRDLAAVLKVVSVRPEPPIQQLPQKRPQDVISAPVTKIPRSFTVPPTSKPVVSEEVAVKQRPFQSAKDQFKADGGKFSENRSSKSAEKSLGVDNSSDLPEELAGCEKVLVEKIENEIIHTGQQVTFDDIAGLSFAKKCVTEMICWPMSRPDLFQGLRSLPRGLLLFGPPGTGKTLIGKAIAHQTGATFFSISSSSLTSKWIGEGEKTVRTLFAVAAYRQPSVVFIDEVDSLLCQRSSEENEASRRMKTEFLVQLDGAATNNDARVVILGATNRPDELDEAARRRFVKRIYIPLPDFDSRSQLVNQLLSTTVNELTQQDILSLVHRTDGFSGADIRSLCTEAAMGPMRELATRHSNSLQQINAHDVPPISMRHLEEALENVQPSVSPNDLQRYLDWNATYGSFRNINA